ncbi:MAG: DUF3857 domain-containing protein [Candidatus Omnitrophica bacterium]|nr:DUF3857 domain-containing protein [Candidatus Omnitrophota bacterium]MCM8831795.1 DUF3857 domain-containing protein [Candidatus Omnitrophota bacterium]
MVKVILALSLLFFACSSPLENLNQQYKKITRRYESAIIKNPQNIVLRMKLASFYYELSNYQKVKELLSNVSTKEAKILLAKSLVYLKEYSSALEIFESLGEIDDGEYLYLYGKTLEEKNLFPGAIKIYKKIKGPFKDYAQKRLKEITITIEKKYPKTIERLLKKEENFLSKIIKEEAAILLCNEVVEIKEDNTSLSTLHFVGKILREKGKNLAEVEIEYDSTYQRVELEYARTITKDKAVIYAGKEHIRDVSKYLDYPLYSNAKAFIISMPAVEVGSIIEYKVKIYSYKLINKNNFSFIYRLKEKFPIANAHFRLIVPNKIKVNFKLLNLEYANGINLNPIVYNLENKTIYDWKFKNIPPIIVEASMPPLSEVNPSILISNFSSWDQIYNWWYSLYKDKIILNETVKKFLKGLIENSKTDLDKIKKIYEFCAKDIRYVAVEYGESGYEPHRAVDIFWNRYGDCKDKAVLLVSLLREAGFMAYPVLISTKNGYDAQKDFPSLNFNHAIVALSYNQNLIFMDPTSCCTSFFDLPLDDQDRTVVVFFDDGYKILNTPLFSKNITKYTTDIYIKENEDAILKRTIKTIGYPATYQRYYFKNTHPDIIEENLKHKITSINPFSILINYSIKDIETLDKVPTLEYTFKARKFLNPAKDLKILPTLFDIDISPALIAKQDRIFGVEFEWLSKKISKTRIVFPKNLKIKYLPLNKKISNIWFDFQSKYQQRTNFLEIYKVFVIKKKFISIDEYKEFKKALEEVLYLLKEEVILEKNDGKEEKERFGNTIL